MNNANIVANPLIMNVIPIDNLEDPLAFGITSPGVPEEEEEDKSLLLLISSFSFSSPSSSVLSLLLLSRYPPYANKKDKLIASSQQKYGGRVWFNREGNVRIGGPPLLFSAWNNALGVAELVRDFIGAGL